MLDERAGSPPSAGELLRRYAADDAWDALDLYLRDWETWAAELLESHLSYPLLAYFRSQHDNQSWLASLTTILDTCALTLAGVEDLQAPRRHQARLTYAMARHAAVDLAQILLTKPSPPTAGTPVARRSDTLAGRVGGLMPARIAPCPRRSSRAISRVRRAYATHRSPNSTNPLSPKSSTRHPARVADP